MRRRTTIVVADDGVNTYLSFRNISASTSFLFRGQHHGLVDSKVLTAAALERLEEVLA
ncbi:MAG: hypothetical protein ACLT98_09755 [Eggerthellaceae bacterium]